MPAGPPSARRRSHRKGQHGGHAAGAAGRGSRPWGRQPRTVLALAGGVVLVAAAAVGVVMTSSSHRRGRTPETTPVAAGPTTVPTTSKAPPEVAKKAVCPLTGTPAPAGRVPQRPALAIKVGNNPGARPQSGLSSANIVFEVPIEGAITRLIAVYQCYGAPAVGPVRSTRWVDLQVLEQLGRPIFGFAGGIDQDQALIASSPLFDANFFLYYGAYTRSPARLEPNNLYVATSALWALDSSHTPPPALFSYSGAPLAAQHPEGISAADLDFSGILQVVWQWDAKAGRFMRFYGTVPADGAGGGQLSAANVVVERVQTVPGPYVEDSEGALGVHSITVGRGTAIVLRDGVAVKGYWERGSISDITRLVSGTGATIALAPGSTWVELVPTTSSVSLVPN